MKNKLILTLLAFFLILVKGNGQEVMTINGDTIVAITPADVITINSIITDYEWLKKETAVLDSIIKCDSLMLDVKDSIIEMQSIRESIKDEYYQKQINSLIQENIGLKISSKKTWLDTAGPLGLLVGLLIGIFL